MFPCITPVSAHFWPPLEKGPLKPVLRYDAQSESTLCVCVTRGNQLTCGGWSGVIVEDWMQEVALVCSCGVTNSPVFSKDIVPKEKQVFTCMYIVQADSRQVHHMSNGVLQSEYTTPMSQHVFV